MALGLAAVVGTVSGIYLKIRHDAVVEEKAKVENEKRKAISAAQAAKDAVRLKCLSDPDQCLRSLDEWFRD